MKIAIRWPACLLVASFLFFASANIASARGRRGWRHAPPPPKPVYTAITSVDRGGMTITTAPKNSTGTTPKTYHFTPETKITLDGNPGTLGDLKAGQRIRVGLGADADVAEELAITSPPRGAGGKPKRDQRHLR